jgi:PAS domain S-box-containing protein
MVHVEKIIVKGNTYYKLVHSVRKDGKVKGISKYIGKVLPPDNELEQLKKDFFEQIMSERRRAKKQEVLVANRGNFAQSLDQQYLTPLHTSFGGAQESSVHLYDVPERFLKIIETLEEVIYIADPDTFVMTFISKSIKEISGYSKLEWLADSTLLERLIVIRDRKIVVEKLKMALHDKSPFDMRYKITHKDSRVLWVHHKIMWEKDTRGFNKAVVGIFRDVTVEQESITKFKHMFDDSPVPMMDVDYSGVKNYLTTYGLRTKKDVWERFAENPQELHEVEQLVHITNLNNAVVHLFNAENKDTLLEVFYSKHFLRDSNRVFIDELLAIAEGKNSFESKLNVFSLDGRRIQLVIKWSVSALYEDTYGRVQVTFLDTTFQREISKMMDIKNYAVESSPSATAITDIEGKISYVNKSFLQLWSIENLSHAVGTNIKRYFTSTEIGNGAIHTLHAKEHWEGNIFIGENQEVFLKSNAVVVRDSFDEPIALVFSFVDLTEVKKSENIRLEFTNIAAHELKTPLVPLKTLLTMIYEDPAAFGVNKQGTDHLAVCLRNVNRLNVLVGDILDISRLESGGMKFKVGTYNFGTIIEDIENNFTETIEKGGVRFRIQAPKKFPDMVGDGQRISQVLGNLVKNANNFTESGTIFVKVSLGEDKIQVDIIDTGMGIPKVSQSKLFTKFYQVQDITTRKSKGSGLGLAICKGIIEYHGGKIWAYSQGKGLGSTFSFSLPLKFTKHKEKKAKKPTKMLIGEKMLLRKDPITRTHVGTKIPSTNKAQGDTKNTPKT